MVDKPYDLALPKAVVSRIINEALPPQANVSAEARKVIGKTATIFILYATATASAGAVRSGRKTLQANDVLDAMKELGFEQFMDPLKRSLGNFRDKRVNKKQRDVSKKSEETAPVRPVAAIAKAEEPTINVNILGQTTPMLSPEKSGSKIPSPESPKAGKTNTSPPGPSKNVEVAEDTKTSTAQDPSGKKETSPTSSEGEKSGLKEEAPAMVDVVLVSSSHEDV